MTSLDARDYAALLHVAGDHAVSELAVEPEDWLAGRTLRELDLRDEGVVVLGDREHGAAVAEQRRAARDELERDRASAGSRPVLR